MQVRKRNGDAEPVDVNKIVRAVDWCADGLDDVDPLRVATKTISGLYDGATTAELDRLSIQTAAEMTEEPQYSRLAARLLSTGVRGSPSRGSQRRTWPAIQLHPLHLELGRRRGLPSGRDHIRSRQAVIETECYYLLTLSD